MLPVEEARQILDTAELVHSAETCTAAVARVADEVARELRELNPLVLCVMAGGVVFAGQLLPRLDFPLEIDYLHVTRYGQNVRGGALSWRAAPWTSVNGRDVLVIDDILDEGITLAAIRDRLLQLGAASVRCAVFVEKDNGKQRPVAADFVGLRVPDRFVFGFGMDIAGMWRNLPAIYAAASPRPE